MSVWHYITVGLMVVFAIACFIEKVAFRIFVIGSIVILLAFIFGSGSVVMNLEKLHMSWLKKGEYYDILSTTPVSETNSAVVLMDVGVPRNFLLGGTNTAVGRAIWDGTNFVSVSVPVK